MININSSADLVYQQVEGGLGLRLTKFINEIIRPHWHVL